MLGPLETFLPINASNSMIDPLVNANNLSSQAAMGMQSVQ